jgi:hypothetical protein
MTPITVRYRAPRQLEREYRVYGGRRVCSVSHRASVSYEIDLTCNSETRQAVLALAHQQNKEAAR